MTVTRITQSWARPQPREESAEEVARRFGGLVSQGARTERPLRRRPPSPDQLIRRSVRSGGRWHPLG